jgi:hypothetical protein
MVEETATVKVAKSDAKSTKKVDEDKKHFKLSNESY